MIPLHELAAMLVLSAMFAAAPLRAAEYYVAPDGTPEGDGSVAKPWDLQTALSHPAAVKPGDTIWLRGGTYQVTRPVSKLTGTPEAHILVKQYPGERAIIDPASLVLSLTQFFNDGAYTEFRDFGLVKIYRADEFNVSAERIFQDTAPRRIRQNVQWGTETVPAVKCKVEDPIITLDLKNMPVGMFYVSVIGRVDKYKVGEHKELLTEKRPTDVDEIPRIRTPLYVHLRINDGPNGETSDYRMRVPYRDSYQEVARIFFNILRPGDYKAEVYVGKGSVEDLTIKTIELRDGLAGCEWRAIKKDHYLFSTAERDAARANNPPRPITDDLPKERAERDKVLWDAMPPLNTQHQWAWGQKGSSFTDSPGEEKGSWALKEYTGGLPGPWVMENKELGLTYTLDDYKAHKPLPEPYNYPDTGQGYYDPDKKTYYVPVALAMFSSYGRYMGAAADLAERYHSTGDLAAARDGALMYVREAMQLPAMEIVYQELRLNTAIPDLEFNWDNRFRSPRLGKLYYSGWSDVPWREYDKYFDFIKDNQEFAQAVGRFVPWVKTPEDVIKLLDVYVVQAGVQDYVNGSARAASISMADVILGPEKVTDLSKAPAEVYPILNGVWTDMLAASFTRDGCHYIGSWACYAPGECQNLLGIAGAMLRNRMAGNTPPFDFSDIKAFPKVGAAASSLLDGMVAGGYELSVGDASGETNGGRKLISAKKGEQETARATWNDPGYGDYRYHDLKYQRENTLTAWRLTKDWRYAWILRNFIGRFAAITDKEWDEMGAQAAGRRDPKLSQISRVMGGFGMGILESGSASDDYRAKRALTMRTGTGVGHAHSDMLDINLWAHGLRAATDHGSRNEGELWTSPSAASSRVHNVVEVDGNDFSQAGGWLEAFKPLEGAQYMRGAALSGYQPGVAVFKRDSALIDVDDGTPGLPALTPNSYVFDVFRVKGGDMLTWCFHGCDSDDLKVNADLQPAEGDADKYLAQHLPDGRRQGKAGDVVEATWQLRRKVEDIASTLPGREGVVNLPNAEENMLQTDYDEGQPRKFTRVMLFGHEGDNILVGNPFSVAYNYCFPNVYVQTAAATNPADGIYPAIIEPYVGAPFITSAKLLYADKNALGAAAVEVKTKNGRTDVCFADGDGGNAVELPGSITAQAQFAYYSTDFIGPRVIELVGGKALKTPLGSIDLERDAWTGAITSVDYPNLKMTVDHELPVFLADEQLNVFNDRHRTNYRLVASAPGDRGTVLTYDRDPETGQSQVLKIQGQTVETAMEYALENYANRNAGLTASNESLTDYWKFRVTSHEVDASLVPVGTNPPKVHSYELEGKAPRAEDFTDVDNDGRKCVKMFDFGPGDQVSIPAHVQLIRRTPMRYELIANAPCTVTLPKGVELFVSFQNNREILASGLLPEPAPARLIRKIATEEKDGMSIAKVTAADLTK